MPTHSGTYIEVLDQLIQRDLALPKFPNVLDQTFLRILDEEFGALPDEISGISFTYPPAKRAWYRRLRFWFQRLVRWR